MEPSPGLTTIRTYISDTSVPMVQLIIDKLNVGVILSDQSGNVIMSNKKANEIAGTSEDTMDIKTWKDTYKPMKEDKVTLYDHSDLPMIRALTGTTTVGQIVFIKSNNKQNKFLSVDSYPIFNHDSISGSLTLITDITEQRQLRDVIRDLAGSIETLKAMVINAMETLEPTENS